MKYKVNRESGKTTIIVDDDSVFIRPISFGKTNHLIVTSGSQAVKNIQITYHEPIEDDKDE